jgi:hypothetical protein
MQVVVSWGFSIIISRANVGMNEKRRKRSEERRMFLSFIFFACGACGGGEGVFRKREREREREREES